MPEKTTTKKTTANTMAPTPVAPSEMERVPYMLPLTRENAKSDKYVFVSVNDYTATIERGKTVMIPRYVANALDQQRRDEDLAFLQMQQLADEFTE